MNRCGGTAVGGRLAAKCLGRTIGGEQNIRPQSGLLQGISGWGLDSEHSLEDGQNQHGVEGRDYVVQHDPEPA
jgi:hypothetical protein